MAKVLTAADIIAAQDRKRELVEVPEWGGAVYVQELSAADAEAVAREDMGVIAFCARCICDEDGEPLFTQDQVADLGKKSPKALERITRKITELGASEVEEGKS